MSGNILVSHIGNYARLWLEVSGQVGAGNAASEGKDADALSSSRKPVGKMVARRKVVRAETLR